MPNLSFGRERGQPAHIDGQRKQRAFINGSEEKEGRETLRKPVAGVAVSYRAGRLRRFPRSDSPRHSDLSPRTWQRRNEPSYRCPVGWGFVFRVLDQHFAVPTSQIVAVEKRPVEPPVNTPSGGFAAASAPVSGPAWGLRPRQRSMVWLGRTRRVEVRSGTPASRLQPATDNCSRFLNSSAGPSRFTIVLPLVSHYSKELKKETGRVSQNEYTSGPIAKNSSL